MGRSPECPACRAPVYPAESFMASDRTPFHKSCVKCRNCTKTLTSNTLNEHNQQLYCRPCYENLLNPKNVWAHHPPPSTTFTSTFCISGISLRQLRRPRHSRGFTEEGRGWEKEQREGWEEEAREKMPAVRSEILPGWFCPDFWRLFPQSLSEVLPMQ